MISRSPASHLRLHAARDVVYVILYAGLAWWQPTGPIVVVVAVLLAAEIAITLADFVVEDRDRPTIGGMAPGERVLHSLMAIVYGAMLARLVPVLGDGIGQTAGIERHDAPLALSIATTAAACGIAVSCVRDALALAGFDPIWRRTADRRTTAHLDAVSPRPVGRDSTKTGVLVRRRGAGTRRVSA